MKNINDLKLIIGSDFFDFSEFIKKYEFIISTGKLSEYYCSLMFDITLNTKSNDFYDGVDAENKIVEIKQRKFISRIPGGMKIDLNRIDYVLYVFLGADLLPDEIIRIDKNHIRETSNKRVSFKEAIRNKKYETIYKR